MIKEIVDNKFLILLVFVVAAIRISLIAFPQVNLEFAFIDGAKYFLSPEDNKILLDQYFNYQANTLGLPLLLSGFARCFPGADILVLMRLLNVAGIFLLSFSAISISRHFGKDNTLTILALILLNPLVWTFSGRATADFLPMALGLFAIALALVRRDLLILTLTCGIIFGVAAVLKYHVLSLLIIFSAIHLGSEPSKKSLLRIFIFSIPAIAMVGIYLLKMYFIFGFWFTPQFQTAHQIHFSSILNNFILYVGFLALLCLPSFWTSKEYCLSILKYRKSLGLILSAVILFAIYGLKDTGELNFGPLDVWLDINLRMIILSMMGLAGLLLIFKSANFKSVSKVNFYVGIAIIFVLLVFSLTRPSQRYLILLIPFFILMLPITLLKSRFVVFSTLAIFISADIVIELSRYATGGASKNIADMVEISNLLAETDPGVIDGHQGNRFYSYRNLPKQYIVVPGDKSLNPGAILSSPPTSFLIKKSFSVVPLNLKHN
jgi:hypothetical protein